MLKHELIEQLKKGGVDQRVVEAIAKIRRESFVPEHLKSYAYEDMALPLDDGSALSQPSAIVFMLNQLDLHQGQKILEIGSGSGYFLALLSEIIKNGNIYGLELNKNLAVISKMRLSNDTNVEIFHKNGFSGLPEKAPFDRIIVSAATSGIPEHLFLQLKENGVLLVPVKQSLVKVIRRADDHKEITEFPGFSFVPLKGE